MILWPLFFFTIETEDEEKARWCIEVVMQTGKLEESAVSDADYRCVNAKQTARLMKEVTEQQKKRSTRVDSRFAALELFGYAFPIV